MIKLREKLEKELSPGAKVITHTDPIPDWEPKAIIEVGDTVPSAIYLYEVM